MEVTKLFDWHSNRARRARLGKALSPWTVWLELLVVILLVGGIVLLVLSLPIGWLAVGLSVIPAMITEWYRYDLRSVAPVQNGKRIDDVLDSELLARLPEQPSPQDIATVLATVNSGIFFEVRFGVGGNLLKQVVSDKREDTPALFEAVLEISRTVSGGKLSAGEFILAMVRQLPGRETLLGHLSLSEDDIIRGIQWYHHLLENIASSKQRPARPGGIGRDWSFGWIPNLSQFGINISQSGTMARPDVRGELLEQLVQTLGGQPGAIALVGKTGVGKTELVYQLADKLMHPDETVAEELRYQQVFMLDASRLLAAAPGKGELEGLVSELLSEAFAAKNIIVCLDNAELFFQEGVGSIDLTSLLLPIFEAGRLPMILTLDEQRFLQIGKKMPALAAALRQISVHPTSESDTLKILEDHLPNLEYKRKVTYMYQALNEAYDLSKRYVYDIAMPGQAISLLDATADYAESGLVTLRSVNTAVERTVGVKTGKVSDTEERDKLLNLEALIHERMIGQDRAVRVVSDALRRSRAGVRNKNRPIGTFLFLGPTGVGKTELAKSLAAVYFGGEEHIIRLDMNEFVSAADVARLIADGADNPNSLTAMVMKKPFSVVLLDEIEKADSAVLSTLLQLLDEGILRDERNRDVSFRDTIVIATSNAGSDRIQEYIHRGYDLEQFEDTFINELLSSRIFHPEFLNRFDEMVVFAPLTKPELLKVVDLILASVNKNLASQNISVAVSSDAKDFLVEAGYDPRLGARPMRRVVQRAVESTVAKLLLSGEATPGGTIELSLEQIQSLIETKNKAKTLIEDNNEKA